MRPIDADALKERLQNIAYDDWNQGITMSFADACNKVIEIVEEQPTIEPPKGMWYDVGSLSCRCSECGCKANKEYSYCPNCGARMTER
jgi:hypothetical protein